MPIDYSVLPLSKGKTIKQIKAHLARAEAKVAAWCRAQCVERDSLCRLGEWEMNPLDWHSDAITDDGEPCSGPSQWAHMHSHRRSKTRGLDPTERHDPKHSLMLCQRHHDEYDGRVSPRLLITCMTRKGANGPLKFKVKS